MKDQRVWVITFGIIAMMSMLIGGTVSQSLPTNLFVNFIPNQVNETCEGDVGVGVGYSFAINQCIQLQGRSYYFVVDALRAGWKVYNSTECKGKFDVESFKNGSCVFAEFAWTPSWTTMYISESEVTSPSVPLDTIIYSQYSEKDCKDLQFYYYFVTGYQFATPYFNSTFSCDSQTPMDYICMEGCKGTAKHCCVSKELPTTCESDTNSIYSCNTIN
ncbi:hypothetical protein DFA_04406 [Cavenderia fasciculata]|uniref:Uncharacterized protein n=1 Tax=Cavenderia fasciculata TaxID=261658 RepID=F4PPH5_CACFS|nr:uncharacterized protein DFA_04406 [Cavenderia fasciculata]EGG22288.1 hypothetical protein DFA_04406 [Cavenderia fasciculata]|eukprot:XP_004360139.1 hypothetical protein DFA_04406 [Cavenderia fasciculata]